MDIPEVLYTLAGTPGYDWATRRVILTRRRRLLRSRGRRKAGPNPNPRLMVDPNPNPRKIRPSRTNRLTIATWRHGRTSLDRRDGTPSMAILTRIASNVILGIQTSFGDVTRMGRHSRITR